jgi:predicted DNA binding CopG/RHH family protein
MKNVYMTPHEKPVFDLDEEEQILSDSIDRGEWSSVKNLGEEKRRARQAASNYLKKNARINIRMSQTDLDQIKQKAAYKGLPYQTLIASVLHQYAAGHLKE